MAPRIKWANASTVDNCCTISKVCNILKYVKLFCKYTTFIHNTLLSGTNNRGKILVFSLLTHFFRIDTIYNSNKAAFKSSRKRPFLHYLSVGSCMRIKFATIYSCFCGSLAVQGSLQLDNFFVISLVLLRKSVLPDVPCEPQTSLSLPFCLQAWRREWDSQQS